MSEKLEELKKALTALIGRDSKGNDRFALQENNGQLSLSLHNDYVSSGQYPQNSLGSWKNLDKILKDLGFNGAEIADVIADPSKGFTYTANIKDINEGGIDFINKYKNHNPSFFKKWEISLKVVRDVNNMKDVIFDSLDIYYPIKYLGSDAEQAKENIDNYKLKIFSVPNTEMYDFFSFERKDYIKPNNLLFSETNVGDGYTSFFPKMDTMHQAWDEAKKEAINVAAPTINYTNEPGNQNPTGNKNKVKSKQ